MNTREQIFEDARGLGSMTAEQVAELRERVYALDPELFRLYAYLSGVVVGMQRRKEAEENGNG